MKNCRIKFFFRIICLAMILVACLSLLCACDGIFIDNGPPEPSDYWKQFSEEEHLAAVKARVEKRYIKNHYDKSDYDYITGYTIYPLYDQNDELSFFMVDIEPYGFVMVKINKYYKETSLVFGLYLRDERLHSNYEWSRYRVYTDSADVPESGWVQGENTYYSERYYEADEDGEIIKYRDSYFKVAGIAQDERKYMLEMKINSDRVYIPAVKRGDKWLNLISMEAFDLDSLSEDGNYAYDYVSYTKEDNL
ncbi:MAG: hypothetical protein K2J16_04600 [Clostridia bacterium]|nr:hypothetical protein [Clostridia bacterium]